MNDFGYWYDIGDDEKLIPMMTNDGKPVPRDFDNCYPVRWGVLGYIYFNTKIGPLMVNSSSPSLEGKKVEITIE